MMAILVKGNKDQKMNKGNHSTRMVEASTGINGLTQAGSKKLKEIKENLPSVHRP